MSGIVTAASINSYTQLWASVNTMPSAIMTPNPCLHFESSNFSIKEGKLSLLVIIFIFSIPIYAK